MSMYSLTSSKFNPYRQGVLIGNFVEDIFGDNIRKRQMSQTITNERNGIKSEFQDKYKWPHVTPEMFRKDENELTMTCNSNYDLDVDWYLANGYSKAEDMFRRIERGYGSISQEEINNNELLTIDEAKEEAMKAEEEEYD